MAVTLAVTDNADGTGGIATVSGVTGGTTTTVYRSAFTGSMKSYDWTSVGTITGNSTLAVATVGYWVWFAVNNNAGVLTFSNMYYQNFTNGLSSIHYDIMQAIVTRINTIGLDVQESKVLLRWIPRPLENIDGNPPFIFICPLGVEQDASKLMARDDIGYPVGIFIVDAGNQNYKIHLQRDLAWREKIAKALRHQLIPGLGPEVFNSKVEYGGIIDVSAFLKNHIVSGLVMRFFVRELRGLGA